MHLNQIVPPTSARQAQIVVGCYPQAEASSEVWRKIAGRHLIGMQRLNWKVKPDLDERMAEKRYIPDEVLRGDYRCGDRVSKCVQFNGLMRLKVLLSKEYVKVGVFLD